MKGSVLYIKHAEKEDVGIYHCLAATEDGRVIETLAARLGRWLNLFNLSKVFSFTYAD